MSDEPAIILDGVSKMYHTRAGTGTLLSMIPGLQRRESDAFWALKDVSFEVRRGECLGIIGPNGAGKSTILKVLSRITSPTSGRFDVRGRLSSLIEVGAGFHPELTGRENVYLNAAILGMSRAETEAKFDAIVDFAELWDFIDVPVKRYSSGMYVRLGFAVAIHTEPDVLLVDEVLAVGDVGFRSKCYETIADRLHRSAVVFVSHSLPTISRICDRVTVIHQGAQQFLGGVAPGIEEYSRLFRRHEKRVLGTGEARIENLRLVDENGNESNSFAHDSPLKMVLDVAADARYERVHLSVSVGTPDMQLVAQCHSGNDGVTLRNTGEPQRIELTIPRLPLSPGQYYLGLIVYDERGIRPLAWHYAAEQIHVSGAAVCSAATLWHADWRVGQP